MLLDTLNGPYGWVRGVQHNRCFVDRTPSVPVDPYVIKLSGLQTIHRNGCAALPSRQPDIKNGLLD
jgi:hypothetical protein